MPCWNDETETTESKIKKRVTYEPSSTDEGTSSYATSSDLEDGEYDYYQPEKYRWWWDRRMRGSMRWLRWFKNVPHIVFPEEVHEYARDSKKSTKEKIRRTYDSTK